MSTTDIHDHLSNPSLLADALCRAEEDLAGARAMAPSQPADAVVLLDHAGQMLLAKLSAFGGEREGRLPNRLLLRRRIHLAASHLLPDFNEARLVPLEAAAAVIERARRPGSPTGVTVSEALAVGDEVARICAEVREVLETGLNPAEVALSRAERDHEDIERFLDTPENQVPARLSSAARAHHDSARLAIRTLWLHGGTAAHLHRTGNLMANTDTLLGQWAILAAAGVLQGREPSAQGMVRLAELGEKAGRYALADHPFYNHPEGAITPEERQGVREITGQVLRTVRESLAGRLAPLTRPDQSLQPA